MTALALLDHHPAHRHLRMLGADLVFSLPVRRAARPQGRQHAGLQRRRRAAARPSGELVGVWPEGFKGIGKPFRERYKLQRFGRGGFVSAALRTGAPIIPCSIVGAEETYPMLGNAKTLARLLGLPYLPITPTFPLLGPLGACRCRRSGSSSSASRSRPPTSAARRRPRTRCSSSTSPTRCARRSSRRSTRCSCSGAASSSAAERADRRVDGCRAERRRSPATAQARVARRPGPSSGGGAGRARPRRRRRARRRRPRPARRPWPPCGRCGSRGRPSRCARACSRSAASGLIATACPTADSIGMSLMLSL